MKWIIASDIHGCKSSMERLIAIFEAEGCEKLLLLGDLLYHGPRNDLPGEYDTKATAALLNQYADRIICVRGNCDAEVDQMVLNFPITDDYKELKLKNSLIFATHGHHIGPDNPPPIGSADILLCGHTHIPACEELTEGLLYVNPGSASIPKGGSKKSFILLNDGVLEFRHLINNKTYHSHMLN